MEKKTHQQNWKFAQTIDMQCAMILPLLKRDHRKKRKIKFKKTQTRHLHVLMQKLVLKNQLVKRILRKLLKKFLMRLRQLNLSVQERKLTQRLLNENKLSLKRINIVLNLSLQKKNKSGKLMLKDFNLTLEIKLL